MTPRRRTAVTAVAALGALVAALLVAAPVEAAVATATGNECTAQTRIADPVAALGELQSDLAWGVTRGAGVVVAVVDSGVAAANPHFAGAMAGGVDLVGDGAGAAGYADPFGHGTAIAGQIAARRIDGSGLEGLAPDARILSVRVYAGTDESDVDAGIGPSVQRLADGIRYAADQRAQVITVSLSTAGDDPTLADAVAYAASRGSLVIAAAGDRDSSFGLEENADDGARYPAGTDGAIGVAAVGGNGVVTADSIHGPHVSVSAPGQNVLTTSAVGGDCVFAADTPATGFAAAYVSAAAALVASAHPDETPAQWAYRLETTAVRPNPDARDDVSGWGFVQPYEAMVLVPGAGVRGPQSPFPEADAVEPPTAPQDPVLIQAEPPANATALAWGAVGAIAAAVLLGTIGAIGVLLRRRRAPVPAAVAAGGRGLFGPDPPDELL